MVMRKIISIDKKKCNGCGNCIPNCAEGALQIIDGKARLISDLFCDGLGACLGHCPEGAISIEERESEPYDEYKVMENVVKGGENVIKAHLKHMKDHNEDLYLAQAVEYLKKNNLPVPEYLDNNKEQCGFGGCPGMKTMDLRNRNTNKQTEPNIGKLESKLRQWPTQLQLINPNANYFENADLVIAADCSAYAYADFHRRFIDGKILMILCPKLDTTIDMYIEKLTMIFQSHNIKSITIVHMEVPCCGGLFQMAKQAV
ncbi:MAG TPA: 4Fe-4S ferredoxin, partial [bacterium]|nr:4Fe-4S ferredoxin [bacterium]